MTAGGRQFEHRMAFDAPVEVDDGMGGTEDDWAEQFRRRGEYLRRRGGERIQAQREAGIRPTIIKVRADHKTRTIVPGWRVRDLDRKEVFEVQDAPETDDRRWIEIVAQSGGAIG